jgi:hypothetical protein
MKHRLLLAAALLLATSALADSPDAILKDYRTRAAQAVERLNFSLKNTATPLISKLVASGDTEGAKLLTSQLKAKVAGEPFLVPQASAAPLFTLYDEARAKALAPVQKSSIARIDSLLKTAGGPKLETITELGNVRAEIEAGKVVDVGATGLPVEWIYRRTVNDRDEATIWLNPGGKFFMDDGNLKRAGVWKHTAEKGTITVQFEDDKWTVIIVDKIGKIHCKIGTRYMVAK